MFVPRFFRSRWASGLLCVLVVWAGFIVGREMIWREANPSMDLASLEALHGGWEAPPPKSVLCWTKYGWHVGGHEFECPTDVGLFSRTRVFEGGVREYVRANPRGDIFTTWPTVTTVISSPYGYRQDPGGLGRKFHNGIDIDCKMGDPIYAAGDGVVTRARFDSVSGNAITLSHGDNWASSYCHLSKMLVSNRQKVHAGDIIGECGNTGRVFSRTGDGSHLHFPIYHGKKTVDPMGQFDLR